MHATSLTFRHLAQSCISILSSQMSSPSSFIIFTISLSSHPLVSLYSLSATLSHSTKLHHFFTIFTFHEHPTVSSHKQPLLYLLNKSTNILSISPAWVTKLLNALWRKLPLAKIIKCMSLEFCFVINHGWYSWKVKLDK